MFLVWFKGLILSFCLWISSFCTTFTEETVSPLGILGIYAENQLARCMGLFLALEVLFHWLTSLVFTSTMLFYLLEVCGIFQNQEMWHNRIGLCVCIYMISQWGLFWAYNILGFFHFSDECHWYVFFWYQALNSWPGTCRASLYAAELNPEPLSLVFWWTLLWICKLLWALGIFKNY